MFRSLRKRVLTSRSAHWVKANVTVADVPAFDDTEFHNFKIDKGAFSNNFGSTKYNILSTTVVTP